MGKKSWDCNSFGKVLATPGALAALSDSGESFNKFLARYARADFGELDAHDRKANELALANGGRIFAVYRTTNTVRLYVITEAEDDEGRRSCTTILLPEEY